MSTTCAEGLGRGTRTFPISVGGRKISDAADALRRLAEPWPRGSFAKEAIDRASKEAGLSYWRAFDIWYRKARRIEEFETDQLIERLFAQEAREARNEFQELRTRLARLESRLVQADPNFHRPTIDALGQSLRRSR